MNTETKLPKTSGHTWAVREFSGGEWITLTNDATGKIVGMRPVGNDALRTAEMLLVDLKLP